MIFVIVRKDLLRRRNGDRVVELWEGGGLHVRLFSTLSPSGMLLFRGVPKIREVYKILTKAMGDLVRQSQVICTPKPTREKRGTPYIYHRFVFVVHPTEAASTFNRCA